MKPPTSRVFLVFGDGSAVQHFAVRTRLWDWQPKRLLVWHREKAGTIEAVHYVLKNELAAGVLPCGRYGANAAWFRLAVITYNVLTAMKRLVLPPDLQMARPKRLGPLLPGYHALWPDLLQTGRARRCRRVPFVRFRFLPHSRCSPAVPCTVRYRSTRVQSVRSAGNRPRGVRHECGNRVALCQGTASAG